MGVLSHEGTMPQQTQISRYNRKLTFFTSASLYLKVSDGVAGAALHLVVGFH